MRSIEIRDLDASSQSGSGVRFLARLACLAFWSALLLPCILPGLAAAAGTDGHDLPLEPAFLFTSDRHSKSVAWGDMDGDGDLDLALGNAYTPNEIHRNDGDGLFSLAWESPDASLVTRSLAWGDWDGDGDLDLAVGNDGQPNRIWRNEGDGGRTWSLAWQSPVTDTANTSSVAWGDYDGDGDLDLAVGNHGQPNQLWRNEADGGGGLSLAWESPDAPPRATNSVAWGDYDGDGDLDLAVGNEDQANQIFRNDTHPGGTAAFVLAWQSPGPDETTYSVAWGDYDGDGDLDLVIGNWRQANQLYRNDGPPVQADLGWTFTLVWDSADLQPTRSIAWGDMDGDTDLDLIVGNGGTAGDNDRPNQIFGNEGAGNFSLIWESVEYNTFDLAPADMDGDGDLDLAVANHVAPSEVYRNDASAVRAFVPGWRTTPDAGVKAVAWGDYDGDGDLDLAAGHTNRLRTYRNDGTGSFALDLDLWWSGKTARSVAWGDYDGDGDLDLAVGNLRESVVTTETNQLYVNDGHGGLSPQEFGTAGQTMSIAWADYDGDGDLDLAIGNDGQPSQIYRNDHNTGGTLALAWEAPVAANSKSVAWGDYDGDGDPDLAVGNEGQPNQVYRNDGTTIPGGDPAFTLAWEAAEARRTHGLAWGDYDGDGDLDLIVGNGGFCNQIYRNEGDGTLTLAWLSPDAKGTAVIATADYDGDGDLDLAAGTWHQGVQIYRNQGEGLFTTLTVAESLLVRSMAWGDADGDGDLDLVLGHPGLPVYENTRLGGKGLPDNAPRVTVTRPGGTASADFYSSPPILEADNIPIGYSLFDPEGEPVGRIEASYSLNGGGEWLPAVATSGTATSNRETNPTILASDIYSPLLAIPDDGDQSADLTVSGSGAIADVDVWLTITHTRDADLQAALVSPAGTQVTLFDGVGGTGQDFLGTTLDDQAATPIASASAPFTGTYQPQESLAAFDGEDPAGTWQLVISDTVTGETGSLAGWGLRIKAQPAAYIFEWDTFASGFFGQSDNVRFRLDAYPVADQPGGTGLYHYPGSAAGPYQWSHVFATTFPFRARGTQVRVFDGEQPVEGAMVYRLPAGQATGGSPLADTAGRPYRTGPQGYLEGRGTIGIGDRLVALWPISHTETYTLYYTNAAPTTTGLEAHTVTQPGVQDLFVSADHPLLLFDLDISLEWDAHNDAAYLAELQFDLKRASEYLYDFSDGQVALGHVDLYQNADEWAYSHVVINANNRLRPFASQGGVVITDTVDPDHDTISDTIRYGPGQVDMGSTWNRYGRPGHSLGDDWAIILAHELSHYLLFHDDTYIGLDEEGLLVAVDSCVGSAMGDLYTNPDNTEFVADEGYWQANCGDTLAEQTLGRYEWQTMKLWYPWLQAPSTPNPGPSAMPFDFTTVQVHEPYTPTHPLADPTLYIDYQGDVASSSEARAYLDRGDYLVDLGSPFGGQNRVIARGAQVGDRLCVFDRTHAQFGCEHIEPGDDRLSMRLDPTWNPIIQITPVNSKTMTINVANTVPIEPSSLVARIFPDLGYGEPPITLVPWGPVYSGTFTLTFPAMSGNVQLWVDEEASEEDPRREAIVALSIGGNPGAYRGNEASIRGGGGAYRGNEASFRGGGGAYRGNEAPIVSPDGQMIFFTENPVDFAPGTFFSIQTMAGLPALPPGRTLVGQGYRLVASPGATLPPGSVSIQYLSNDVLVAGADEQDLRLYFYDGAGWLELDTVLNTYFNLASAPSQGEGIYALMATIEIPLYGPGWNLIGYPVRETRPVTEALRSIEGSYTLVKGYKAGDAGDPWKQYNVQAPAHVNDLHVLEYGFGYYIWAAEDVTLYLEGAGLDVGAAWVPDLPPPPATYYGPVLPGTAFSPAPGMTVSAWVDGQPCGQTRAIDVDGQVMYVVDVVDERQSAGCGAPGRQVSFRVGLQAMETGVAWDSAWVDELALSPDGEGGQRLYLPLVLRW